MSARHDGIQAAPSLPRLRQLQQSKLLCKDPPASSLVHHSGVTRHPALAENALRNTGALPQHSGRPGLVSPSSGRLPVTASRPRPPSGAPDFFRTRRRRLPHGTEPVRTAAVTVCGRDRRALPTSLLFQPSSVRAMLDYVNERTAQWSSLAQSLPCIPRAGSGGAASKGRRVRNLHPQPAPDPGGLPTSARRP